MVVLIELCILIVVKIQANNLNSTSLSRLDPIMIPHFSELDETQNPKHQEQDTKPEPKLDHQKLEPEQPVSSCITKSLKDCKENHKPINGQRYYLW
jgi:hypothetical protein